MNHHHSKLNQQQHEHARQHQQSASDTQVLEFPGAVEALRFDAAQTPVPPQVAERLQDSIKREPGRTGSSWWHRLFGG